MTDVTGPLLTTGGPFFFKGANRLLGNLWLYSYYTHLRTNSVLSPYQVRTKSVVLTHLVRFSHILYT